MERQLWLWLTRGDDEARTAVCRVEEGGAVGTVDGGVQLVGCVLVGGSSDEVDRCLGNLVRVFAMFSCNYI